MECILHRGFKPTNDEVVPFTNITLARAQQCSDFWKTSCWPMDVAIAKRFKLALRQVPEQRGYHTNCYIQFTHETRMRKALAAARKLAGVSQNQGSTDADAFPYKCAFCLGQSKVSLTRCSTPELAAKITAAVAERKDKRLLELIIGEDIVSRRLAYHSKCYMKFSYNSPYATQKRLPATVEAAFRDYVANGITTVEVKGRICVPVTALGDLFVKTVADVRAYSGYDGKVGYLMANLKKYCPYRLYAGGKIGIKPLPVFQVNQHGENLQEDDAVWENNGEAVDFQDTVTDLCLEDEMDCQESGHDDATKDDATCQNNREIGRLEYKSKDVESEDSRDSDCFEVPVEDDAICGKSRETA